MMKLAVLVLILFLGLNPSRANTPQDQSPQVFHKHLNSKTQTPTKNALVRAVPKTKRQVLVANNLLDVEDTDSGPGSEEIDLHVGYRRPELINLPDTDDTVDDYVTIRLAVARAKALAAYRNKFHQNT